MFYKITTILALILAIAALWQSSNVQASHLPSLDVEKVRWISEGGTVRNQIWAGSANFGDEYIYADPGTNAWPTCRTKIPSSSIFGICSNKKGMLVGNTVITTWIGTPLHVDGNQRAGTIAGIYDPGDSPTNEYTLEGLFPPGLPSLRAMQGYNTGSTVGVTTPGSAYYCFAPAATGSQHTNVLDACVERVGGKYTPDLKFTAGGKYVLLSELSALLGR